MPPSGIDLTWNIRHDYFNLLALPIVIAINVYYLFIDRSTYWIEYFAFLIYMVIDTLWLLFIPESVASPGTIIIHHVVCIVGWSAPLLDNLRYTDLLSYAILVEINTWLLIARRNFKNELAGLIFAVGFYVTWIGFRLIMYPIILYLYISLYYGNSIESGSFFSVGLGILLLMIVINVLNVKWSYDLFTKQFMRKEATSPPTRDSDEEIDLYDEEGLEEDAAVALVKTGRSKISHGSNDLPRGL